MTSKQLILESLKRGTLSLFSRPLYIVSMVVIPLLSAVFFVTLLSNGVITKAPTAIVDLDRTPQSRQLIHTIGHMQAIDITATADTYAEGIDLIQRGEVLGFFMIPAGYGKESISGKTPQLSYYINYCYFAPANYMMKGYTVTSAFAGGGIAKEKFLKVGINPEKIQSILRPYLYAFHPIGNPRTNYSVYLCNSFVPCILALMVMIMTAFTITEELKRGTSRQWLDTAGGNIIVALLGKMLPQTVIFSITGIAIQAILFGFCKLPLHCSIFTMMLAMFLTVIACQALALLITCALPNMRWSIAICSLVGMLSFSFTGFSFPIENMYPSIAIFSYLVPIRYYFLIYADQALAGIPFAYSAKYFAMLLCFIPVGGLLMLHLKKFLERPVYIP